MDASAPAAAPHARMDCPDPSAHRTSHNTDPRLQDSASKAALLVSQPGFVGAPSDADSKLASSSAATSLKRARPQDLPSFPIVGIDKHTSAGKAATLAHANQRSVDLWRPDASAAAGKAALLANDHRTAGQSHSPAHASVSKDKATAQRSSPKTGARAPNTSQDGNSAASIAMRNHGTPGPTDHKASDSAQRWALQAATGSVKARRRAGSLPPPEDKSVYSSKESTGALSAATIAHRTQDSNRWDSDAMQSARIQNIGTRLPRSMYTEHPPVQLEVDEERHNAALKASAISFAKQMYQVQDKQSEGSSTDKARSTAAVQAHRRAESASAAQDLKKQAMQYITLQDTARKLASERLAKMNPDESAQFRTYYGYENHPKSRMSIRSRRRPRSSSEGAYGDDGEEQVKQIRSQMSQLNSGLAEVDAKKRTADRLALMAAAEKRVHAQMHHLDEKVFNETGKVSPALMEEWEAKARAKAALDSEQRMKNHGKVHLGNGKFMDQSEVDAIASQRVQPTLDQIADTAEKQRARDEEKRLDEEKRKLDAQKEKERQHQEKIDAKKLKEDEKQVERIKKAEAKSAHRTEKESEKARRKEEEDVAKESKLRSKRLSSDEEHQHRHSFLSKLKHSEPKQATAPTSPNQNAEQVLDDEERPTSDRPSSSIMPQLERHISTIPSSSGSSAAPSIDNADAPSNSGPQHSKSTASAGADPSLDTTGNVKGKERPESGDSPTKKEKGLRNLLGRFTGKKKTTPGSLKPLESTSARSSDGKEGSSFVGGAALKGDAVSARSSSQYMDAEAEAAERRSGSIDSEVSSLSDEPSTRGRRQTKKGGTGESLDETHDHFDESRLPPPKFLRDERKSPVRQTVFHEEL